MTWETVFKLKKILIIPEGRIVSMEERHGDPTQRPLLGRDLKSHESQ